MTINADPIMNISSPSHAKSREGIKQAEPTKYRVDPSTDMKKLRESDKNEQFLLV